MAIIFDPYTQGTAGEVPAEQEIAGMVTRDVLPGLRAVLAKLNAIKATSEANGVPAMIDAAVAADTTLAGFNAADWQAWDTAFDLLTAFLSTPQDGLDGATVLGVLLKKYTVQA